jgi:hypothetical protein
MHEEEEEEEAPDIAPKVEGAAKGMAESGSNG